MSDTSMITATLAIIKPDAVASGHTGRIIDLIERSNFVIAEIKKIQLTEEQARAFYEMHSARSFFQELVTFMSSAPVIVMVLERHDAVAAWRDLMGDTNPARARLGSVRALYAQDIGKNAVHGSDAVDSAYREIAFFFPTFVRS